MKKGLTRALLVILAVLACASLASCGGNGKKANPSIVFGKEYVRENSLDTNRSSFVFYSDGTGYYEVHYLNHFVTAADMWTSGKANFVWKVADDGSVSLFSTGEYTYFDDHTAGEGSVTVTPTKYPVSFGDGFMTIVDGGAANRYILKDSKLEKQVKQTSETA